jgi:hypothetical protein
VDLSAPTPTPPPTVAAAGGSAAAANLFAPGPTASATAVSVPSGFSQLPPPVTYIYPTTLSYQHTVTFEDASAQTAAPSSSSQTQKTASGTAGSASQKSVQVSGSAATTAVATVAGSMKKAGTGASAATAGTSTTASGAMGTATGQSWIQRAQLPPTFPPGRGAFPMSFYARTMDLYACSDSEDERVDVPRVTLARGANALRGMYLYLWH